MPKLEWTLEDPKNCDECKMLAGNYDPRGDFVFNCNLGFVDNDINLESGGVDPKPV